MKKIISYVPKDSFLNRLFGKYENLKEICTFQEYLEYNIGIPTRIIYNYFNKNNIPYIENFELDHNKGIKIVSQIITKEIEFKFGEL